MQVPAYVVSRLPAAFSYGAGRVRPAGQASAVPPGAAGTDGNGFYVDTNCNVLDSNGAIIGSPGSYPTNAVVSADPPNTNVGGAGVFNCGTGVIGGGGGGAGGSTPNKTAGTGGGTTAPSTPQAQQALYNTVGGALNTTGATIASIVASNNQSQIASLQAQTQQQIAALNLQGQQAAQQGNVALAQQNAQSAMALGQFNSLLLSRLQPQNTAMYVIAGIAALVVIGGIVYAMGPSAGTKPAATARDNPRRARYRYAA